MSRTELALALCLTAGCGDNQLAPAADAGGDGPVAVGDVAVTTYVRCCATPGARAPGVEVGVVQPDGSQGEGGVTDDQGTLVLHGVRAGAAVSAIEALSGETVVTTFLGVEPGDQLTFGDPYFSQTNLGAIGHMTITAPPLAGAALYEVHASCSSIASGNTPSLQLSINGCESQTRPLVMLAYDFNNHVIASAYLPDGPYADVAMVAFDAWITNPIDNITATLTGLDPDIQNVGLDVRAYYSDTIQILGFELGYWNEGMAQAQFSLPITAPRIIGRALIGNGVEVYGAVAGSATEVMLAAPRVGLVILATYDFDHEKILWTQIDGQEDAEIVSSQWSTEVGTPVVWIAIVPPGVTELPMSVWPREASLYEPSHLEGPFPSVTLMRAPHQGSLRTLAEWQLASPAEAVRHGDLPWGEISRFTSAPPEAARSGRASSR